MQQKEEYGKKKRMLRETIENDHTIPKEKI
jgi:hypothetical protein